MMSYYPVQAVVCSSHHTAALSSECRTDKWVILTMLLSGFVGNIPCNALITVICVDARGSNLPCT